MCDKSFITYMWDVSCISYISFIFITHLIYSWLCVICLIHIHCTHVIFVRLGSLCAMSHGLCVMCSGLCVIHSFIFITQLIYSWDSGLCEIYLIHIHCSFVTYMWDVSCISYICDMSHSYALHICYSITHLITCVQWIHCTHVIFVRLGPLCDMSHSYSLHTCYIRETRASVWYISWSLCDVFGSLCDMSHVPLILYVTCLIYILRLRSLRDMPHVAVKFVRLGSLCDRSHVSFILYVTCLIYIPCHLYLYGSDLCAICLMSQWSSWDSGLSRAWHVAFIRVAWCIHVCDMSHSYVWRDSFIRVTWLIHTCDVTHWYM